MLIILSLDRSIKFHIFVSLDIWVYKLPVDKSLQTHCSNPQNVIYNSSGEPEVSKYIKYV